MNRRTAAGLAPLLVLAGVFGCGDNGTRPRPDSPPADPSPEARGMALYVSAELAPPDGLARRIDAELREIRATFAPRYPVMDSLRFFPPFLWSWMYVRFTEEAAAQIASGEYHDWDELNQRFGLTSMSTGALDPLRIVQLRFAGLLHPRRLGEIYQTLPGVTGTSPVYQLDHPNVYPAVAAESSRYLFRRADGDCLSGCTENEYWYFSIREHHPRFLGTWWPDTTAAEPAWWPEASAMIERYWRGGTP